MRAKYVNVSVTEDLAKLIDDIIEKSNKGYSSGDLKRRKLQGEDIVYIGKEAHNIEEQPLNKPDVSAYIDIEKLKNKILSMTPKEARERGVSRPTLWKTKKKLREKRILKLNSRVIKKLVN